MDKSTYRQVMLETMETLLKIQLKSVRNASRKDGIP